MNKRIIDICHKYTAIIIGINKNKFVSIKLSPLL